MAGTAFLTVATNSHIGYAVTLAKSLARAMPGARLRIYVADRFEPAILPDLAEAQFLAAETCGLEGYADMAGRYNAFEFSTALKAPSILHSLEQTGADGAVYLDSDVWVLGSLEPIAAKLNSAADCILTPHITAPYKAPKIADEDSYLTAGIFNLGFAAFSNSAQSRQFLKWWAAKKQTECTIDFKRGLFVDQTYCNLVPAFFERFHALRDPGFNVAYWNLDQRRITKDAHGVYLANGDILRFVHFSGASIETPDVISKFQQRFTKADVGVFAELLDAYIAEVNENNVFNGTTYSQMTWAHAKPSKPDETVIPVPAQLGREKPKSSVIVFLGYLARRIFLGRMRAKEYRQARRL